MRRVFAGVPLTPHHPAAPSGLTQASQQTPDAPTPPRRPRAPRRPPVAPSDAPPFAQPEAPPEAQPRRGWFARWFGRRPRPAAPLLPPPAPLSDSDNDSNDEDNTPFTPENHPGLSPEFCDFFNTRIDDCDPEMLHLVLAVIATLVAESLPPELGTDPRAIIADMWDRLREPDGETIADAAPELPAEEAPDGLTEAAPNTQTGDEPANLAETASDAPAKEAPASLNEAAPNEPPGGAPASSGDAEPEASPPPPATLPEVLVADAPDSIAIDVAADPPYSAALPRPDHHTRTFHRHRGLSRDSSRRLRRYRPIRRIARRELPPSPPPRRLCYAACAGPP